MEQKAISLVHCILNAFQVIIFMNKKCEAQFTCKDNQQLL